MTRKERIWTLVGVLSLLIWVLVACGSITVEESLAERAPQQTEELVITSPQIDFPFALGNTWIYSGTFYQGSNSTAVLTATYIVTESVVNVLHSDLGTYTIFQIARSEELRYCPPEWQAWSDNWCDRLATHTPTYYWYIFEGNTLYRQERLEAHRLSDQGIRELLWPLEEGQQWYVNHTMALAHPNYEVDSMLRKVVAAQLYAVPAGSFAECFQMQTVVGGDTSVVGYCPQVGFVERSSIHSGTPFGMHEILVEYMIAP